MKKTLLFAAAGLLGLSASAQVPTVSDAPADGKWSDNTTWMVIKNAGTSKFIGTGADFVDADGNLKVNGNAQAAHNYAFSAMWAIVGNAQDGYSFYNREAGTEKVLGMTGSEANARVKLYDVNTTEEGVTTKFDFVQHTNQPTWKMVTRHGGNTGDYDSWNNRNGYLANWANSAAMNNNGSGFIFTEVIGSFSDNPYFTYSDENHTANLATVRNANAAADAFAAAVTALQNETATLNLKDGDEVILLNKQHNLYVNAMTTTTDNKNKDQAGVDMLGTAALPSWTNVWVVKTTADGKYKFYNPIYDKYVGPMATAGGKNGVGRDLRIPLVDEADAAEHSVVVQPGSHISIVQDAITNDSENNAYTNAWHMTDWVGVTRWTSASDASQFTILPADKEAYSTSLIASVDANNYDKIGYKSSGKLLSAIATLEGTKSNGAAAKAVYEALAAVETAAYIRPEAGKFYTIRGAHSQNDGHFISEKYGEQENDADKIYLRPEAENRVAALWQFVACEGENVGDLYYVTSANTQKVLSNCTNEAGDMASIHVTAVDKAAETAGQYDIMHTEWRSNGGVSFVTYTTPGDRQNSAKGCLASDNGKSHLTSWRGIDNNNCWLIELAEEVPVALNEAGYAAVHFPFAAKYDGDVYTITNVNAEKAQIEALTNGNIAANTPVIIKGQPNGTAMVAIDYTGEPAAAADTYEAAQLTGVLAPVAAPANAYVLNGNKLVAATEGVTLPANSMYLTSTYAGDKELTTDDITTAIDEIVAEGAASKTIFDLQGRRVNKASKGVFIINGKKALVK